MLAGPIPALHRAWSISHLPFWHRQKKSDCTVCWRFFQRFTAPAPFYNPSWTHRFQTRPALYLNMELEYAHRAVTSPCVENSYVSHIPIALQRFHKHTSRCEFTENSGLDSIWYFPYIIGVMTEVYQVDCILLTTFISWYYVNYVFRSGFCFNTLFCMYFKALRDVGVLLITHSMRSKKMGDRGGFLEEDVKWTCNIQTIVVF